MNRIVCVAAALALAAPQVAAARPAVVRVFEAEARAEPSRSAPVVQRLAEGAQLSVSEEAQDGWRRVRLPSGDVGWIEEAALTLRDAAADPAAPPRAAVAQTAPGAAAPAPALDLRPRIYVKDVDHLAELMKKDEAIGARARTLASRRTSGFVVGGVGMAVGVGLMLAGMKQNSDAISRSATSVGAPRTDTSPGTALIVAGSAMAIGAGIVGMLIHPGRGELLDLVNDWNRAHPSEQFELERAAAQHQ